MEAYKKIERERAQLPSLVPVDVIADDVTPEGLTKRMYQQGGTQGLLGPEAGPIHGARDRYKKDEFSDIYLKFYSNEAVSVNRKAEGSDLFVPRSSLVIGVMAQPCVLFSLLRDRELEGRGYLGRFLWSIPESRVGSRVKGNPVPEHLKKQYRDLIFRLLPKPGPRVAGEFKEKKRLYLGGKSLELYDHFVYVDIEPKLGRYGDLQDLKAWANRLGTLMLKVATLWHITEAAENGREVPQIIDPKWVLRGIVWAKMFALPMAQKAYGYSQESPVGDMAARALQGVIDYGKPEWNWSAFKKKMFRSTDSEQLRAALNHLVEANYLKMVKAKSSGRYPDKYKVNPLILSPGFQIGQKLDKSGQKGLKKDKSEHFEALLEHRELSPYKAIYSTSSSISTSSIGSESGCGSNIRESRSKAGQKGQKDDEVSLGELLRGVI